jgi:hypothetical protein
VLFTRSELIDILGIVKYVFILLCLSFSSSAQGASSAPVRGVHLTAWVAGTQSMRLRFLDKLKNTQVNAVVVPVKESDGKVYIPGVAQAEAFGTVRKAIPKPQQLVEDLHSRGLRAIARIVVFKDNVLPYKKPDWAIQDRDGGFWTNRGGLAWVDPYKREVWEYNLNIASVAAGLGFDEIQFDYIRFPSDGDTTRCRYSQPHSSTTATAAMTEFVQTAVKRLRPLGVDVSVAVFGLTTSHSGGMGIGQDLEQLTLAADIVSPMMYPSHYGKGEYGIKDPNRSPYKIIRYGLRDAKRVLKEESYKLRPYFQDFSLGFRYGPKQVRAQIRAAAEHGVHSWIFWNPVNRYNWKALGRAEPEPSVVGPPVAPVEALP